MADPQTPARMPSPATALLLDDIALSRLAMELARDILPFEQVIAGFGISRATFADFIAPSTQFQIYYREHRAMWKDGAAVDDRVKAKAAQIVEDFLPVADSILHDTSQGVGVRTNLLKEVIKLAGYTEDGKALNGGATAQPAARVIINFPTGVQIVQPQARVAPIDVTHEVVTPPGNSPPPPPGFNVPLPKVTPPPVSPINPMAPQPRADGKTADGELRWGAAPAVSSLIDPTVKQ